MFGIAQEMTIIKTSTVCAALKIMCRSKREKNQDQMNQCQIIEQNTYKSYQFMDITQLYTISLFGGLAEVGWVG